jgi:MraZ protein
MVTRKTQLGWMALGGVFCLFAVILVCKFQGNRALAQNDKPAPPPDPFGPITIDVHKDSKKADATTKPADKSDRPAPMVSSPLPLISLSAPTAAAKPETKKKEATKLKESPSGIILTGGSLPGISVSTPSDPSPPKPAASGVYLGGSGFKPGGSLGMPNLPSKTGLPTNLGTKPKETSAPTNPSFTISHDFSDVSNRSPSSLLPMMPPSGTTTPPVPPMPSTMNEVTPVSAKSTTTEPRALPGEPPLAPPPGPVQTYQVRDKGETLRDIARRTLGSSERWSDIHKLNPSLKTETALATGTVVRLPADACIPSDETETVRPLPGLRPKVVPARPKVILPLTGTYQANLDDKKTMTLPKALREQLAGSDTVLVSPGPDKCLWLTNKVHLDRLAQRLEQSPAREADVRVFKRLYFAQTEKRKLTEGRVTIPERLAQFAGLHQEVVLVGIDDHFEVWDAARWREYTQEKSAAARANDAE